MDCSSCGFPKLLRRETGGVEAKPIPKLAIRRYAVIEGKPTHRVETPVVLNDRNDSFYRVSMEIRGDRSVLTIQDQLADSWAEPRLKRGGVGFFSDRGEQSRISSVRIAHHDDLMGRFSCADGSAMSMKKVGRYER